MPSRLGNVIYWAACLVAIGWSAIAVLAESSSHSPRWGMVAVAGVGVSALIWLAGRAVKYVLDGT